MSHLEQVCFVRWLGWLRLRAGWRIARWLCAFWFPSEGEERADDVKMLNDEAREGPGAYERRGGRKRRAK